MPTYVYRCTNEKCGDHNIEFEEVQRMVDDPLIHCKTCHHESLVRVIQPTQVILKGEGWTDKHGKYHL